jgi:hypothetical protein
MRQEDQLLDAVLRMAKAMETIAKNSTKIVEKLEGIAEEICETKASFETKDGK